MYYKVECEVDTNDGDYNTCTSKINEKELEMLKNICKRIRNFKPYTSISDHGSTWTHSHNFSTNDCLREDLGEKPPTELYSLTEEEEEFFVYKICPNSQYGFHTVESVVISVKAGSSS